MLLWVEAYTAKYKGLVVQGRFRGVHHKFSFNIIILLEKKVEKVPPPHKVLYDTKIKESTESVFLFLIIYLYVMLYCFFK
jgi:hypothetical protein